MLHLIKADNGVFPSEEELLRELDRQEDEVRRKGFDPYVQGHRLVRGTQSDYRDDLVGFLKEKVRVCRREGHYPFAEIICPLF